MSSTTLLDFDVHGMTCTNCSNSVQRVLLRQPEVDAAEVHFATKRARVRLHASPSPDLTERLIKAIGRAGFEANLALATEAPHLRLTRLEQAEAHEAASLKRDFYLALLLGLPLLVAGMSHGALPWVDTAAGRWTQMVLGTLVLLFPARRFFIDAFRLLAQRSANMFTLVALGVGSAWLYSWVALLWPEALGFMPVSHAGLHEGYHAAPLYLEAAAAIVIFVLLGRRIEARAKSQLTHSLRALLSLQPPSAWRVQADGQVTPIEANQLLVGEHILLKPGERSPCDGLVLEGQSALDESLLTGESLPVSKQVGDSVPAGALNTTGSLTLKVTHVGPESALGRIAHALEEAQSSRAPIAALADKVAARFVPLVLVLAVLTLVGHLALGHALPQAFERFIAVLVIACPCALGLATPAAIAVAMGRASELQVRFASAQALEAAARVQTLVFDKTGTLTEGRLSLQGIATHHLLSEAEALRLAASLEAHSSHPLALALVQAAHSQHLTLSPLHSITEYPGGGLSGQSEQGLIRVGSAAFLRQHGIDLGELQPLGNTLANQGMSLVYVALNDQAQAVFGLRDTPRNESPSVLQTLREHGYHLRLLSGDNPQAALVMGESLGLHASEIEGGTTPEGKAQRIAELAQHHLVAMVGDGINDAPALARAHLGISLSSGTELAQAQAGLHLSHGLKDLVAALDLARTTLKVIRSNLFWAFAYNVVALPIAAGLVPGIVLSPAVASLAMSLSSVSVLANSLRLRRFRANAHVSSPSA